MRLDHASLAAGTGTGLVSEEATGTMREMQERLALDADLAAAYRAAHESYLEERYELGDVPEIHGVSAGGMPTRVKCLHVLVGHALAAGPGVNPLGDEAVAEGFEDRIVSGGDEAGHEEGGTDAGSSAAN